MIPFLKPYIDHKELLGTLRFIKNSREEFESRFAVKFEAHYAVSFPWARSAIFALLRSLNIHDSEVILPAYTCIVVAHAVVMSGNTPVFVDITEDGFNMDITRVRNAITKKTKAIIATNLFGYPLDIDELKNTVDNDDIIIIQDCALAAGTTFHNKYIANEGTAAIYSFNVRKPMTTMGGGMVTTNDESVFNQVKDYRDRHFSTPNVFTKFKKYIFFLSQYLAFNKSIFSIIDYLAENTHFIDSIILDSNEEDIHLPEDYKDLLLNFQASIGSVQLEKFEEIIKNKRRIADYYYENLNHVQELRLPLPDKDSTYSHYCILINDKNGFIGYMRKNNIQIGTYFDYCIPNLSNYKKYKNGEFPNAQKCSREVVNIPNYASLSKTDQDYIIDKICKYYTLTN